LRVAFDFLSILVQWPLLLKGVVWTVGLTAVSALIGVALAVGCAWARTHGPLWLKWVVGLYVELIRNTPFIVQLFFVFFGLPAMGIKLSPEVASVIAMVVNLGAYATEIIRAGIDATPRGQIEAAMSLALTRAQIFLRVVLPPALRKVWPALVSQIIIVMLGSAVCGQISTEELSYAANLIQSRNFRAFEAFIIATGIYLLLSVALRKLLNWLGPRFLFGSSAGRG
jgi:polar amino acid transport system permease protein